MDLNDVAKIIQEYLAEFLSEVGFNPANPMDFYNDSSLVNMLKNLLKKIGNEDDELFLLADMALEKWGAKMVDVIEYRGHLRAIYNVGYFNIDLPYYDTPKPDVESVDSITDKVDIPEYVPISLERARSTLLRYVNVDEYYYQLKTLLEKREWNYDFSNNKQQFFIL